MRWFSCVLLLGLAACDVAGPGFLGAERVTRQVEGSRFTLRFQNGLVEAIRTSPEWLPRFEVIARHAGIAAQMESGCKAEWVEGDPAMMWIGLSCNGEKAPKRPRRPKTLYCVFSDMDLGDGRLQCHKFRR